MIVGYDQVMDVIVQKFNTVNNFADVQPVTVSVDIEWRVECHDSRNTACYNRGFGRRGSDDMGTYGRNLLNGSWKETFDTPIVKASSDAVSLVFLKLQPCHGTYAKQPLAIHR